MKIQKLNESQVNEVLLHFKNAKGDFLLNDINNELFVIGVLIDKNDQILGVILAEYKEDIDKLGVIYSVNVREEFQNKSIEEKLLKFAEKELKTKGAKVLFTNIFSETSPNVKFSLRKQSWTPPVLDKTHFIINVKDMHQENWIETNTFPEDFSVKEWNQIYETELESLRNADWYPKHLSPLEAYHFGETSPQTSFWVFHKDEIIGWILSKNVNDEYLFITSLFIKEDRRNHYILRPLLGEVIKNQLKMNIPYACFDVRNKDKKVLKFFKSYFKNYIHNTVEIHSAYKILGR
ncbi:GNAT family N-acetyltransferase [Lysinibacillus antri]|uniref:N-acetyltransferase n=1 Tax=Lysinibacillus antri TaxID=2498145 RepID=A0A432LCA9_9BACI|nr:GNAT family N-acetyltransferase [Lysinibacillus antri]RUL53220.1 N-acetyltransferase [Lysinibacillus antri]